nr:hypothetical protein GCM10020093_048910 [Planobispora longispora]
MSGRREEEREDGRGDGGVEVPTRILVEGMVREDGTVDAGELYAVAGALGMTDQQVRLCVKRLVAEGRLTQEGRGRRALLRAADDVRRSIAPNAEFMRHMYRQDRGRAPWDGVWHLAGFAVPEAARSARDALREVIVGLGGAPVHGGLYVSPNDWGNSSRPRRPARRRRVRHPPHQRRPECRRRARPARAGRPPLAPGPDRPGPRTAPRGRRVPPGPAARS